MWLRSSDRAKYTCSGESLHMAKPHSNHTIGFLYFVNSLVAVYNLTELQYIYSALESRWRLGAFKHRMSKTMGNFVSTFKEEIPRKHIFVELTKCGKTVRCIKCTLSWLGRDYPFKRIDVTRCWTDYPSQMDSMLSLHEILIYSKFRYIWRTEESQNFNSTFL